MKANCKIFKFYNCKHTPILDNNCDYYCTRVLLLVPLII